MNLDELKAMLENNSDEVVYPTGDYDKRECADNSFIREDSFGELHNATEGELQGKASCALCKYGGEGVFEACHYCGSGREYYKK